MAYTVAAICLCWTALAVAAQSVQTGAVAVRYAGNQGAELTLDQVPLSRGSSVQAYAPGWTQSFYSSIGDTPKVTHKDGALLVTHRGRKSGFQATETIRPAGENRIEITLAGKLPEQVDARLEWTIAYLNAFALYGGSAAAGGSDMLIPILPEPPVAKEPAALVADKRAVHFTSRLGRIDVQVEKGPAELTLIDGRRAPSRWWTQDEPTLWLGILGATIPPGEPFEFTVSIQFHPKPRHEAAPEKAVGADAAALEQAFVPQPRPVQIIPKPRQLKWLDGRFALSPGTLVVADNPHKRQAAEVIVREAKQRFGWDWTIVPQRPDDSTPCILVGPMIDGLRCATLESYAIRCRPELVQLSATAQPGYSYAAQTLVQMFQADPRGAFIQAADIEDAPTLPFRGVHMFTGRDSVDLYRKLCERVLARFKFNHVVLECSYTEWDTDRNIWIKKSVPKEQLAQYVKISRENHLEPIPLVQSLGHMEWMFKNGANRDLAEDPDALWAYDVTNPRTYEFIHGIYREAIDLFKPRYFHIGHDEIAIFGRYPHREESKKLGETELFIRDFQKHDELFRPHDIRPMLWGDMLLAREESSDQSANAPSLEEAQKRRAALPRGIFVADWHYEPAAPEAYKSLEVFRREQFRTIACTWFNPRNIYSFAQAARLYKAEGLLQTTWAGYDVTEQTIERDAKQFNAYVLAGEYAWSGDSPPPDELPYRAEEIFAAAMNPQRQLAAPMSGSRIDLAAAADAPLTTWLETDVDLSGAQGADRVDGIAFESTEEPEAVLLDGALLPDREDRPRQVKLKTHLLAGELAFLHCTAYRASPGAAVAAYDIRYDDDTAQRVELRYGRDIRAWDDLAATSNAPTGWFAPPGGIKAAVRVLRWRNPHPDKAIKSITFSTDHPYASPALLGVTGLGP